MHPSYPVLIALSLAVTGRQTRPVARAATATRIAAVDRFVRRAFALGVTPGLGVAVVSDGRIVYTAGLGHADVQAGIPVSDSTLWYVASTSKSFTGFGVALLEAAGEIDVDMPITRLLPRASCHPD